MCFVPGIKSPHYVSPSWHMAPWLPILLLTHFQSVCVFWVYIFPECPHSASLGICAYFFHFFDLLHTVFCLRQDDSHCDSFSLFQYPLKLIPSIPLIPLRLSSSSLLWHMLPISELEHWRGSVILLAYLFCFSQPAIHFSIKTRHFLRLQW